MSSDSLDLSTAKSELVSRLSQLLGRPADGKDMLYHTDRTPDGMHVSVLTLLGGKRQYTGQPCNNRKRSEQAAALAAVQAGDLFDQPESSGSAAPSSISAPPASMKRTLSRENCEPGEQQRGGAPFKKAKSMLPGVRLCGPSSIQVLRGALFGREVALVCCGEAHEDVIDLTREGCVIEPKRGWVQDESCGAFARMDPILASASKRNATLAQAKSWAEKIIKEDREESAWHDSWLSFDTSGSTDGTGTARVFASDAASRYHGVSATTQSEAMQLFRWADLDDDARELAKRRKAGDLVSFEELDAIVEKRKCARKAQGITLFDDWIIQQAQAGTARVALVLEAPVKASEVELHEDPAMSSAPTSKECHRLMELDSDTDSDEDDAEDGSGSFLGYLERRARVALKPDQLCCVDPRELGDAGDEHSRWLSFQELLPSGKRAVEDSEEAAFTSCAEEATLWTSHAKKGRPRHRRAKARRPKHCENAGKEDCLAAIPSWEAFFGAAAELLYYSPHVKADYAQFLAGCIGTSENMREFFLSLFFDTVPEAVAKLKLDEVTRPLARIRSLLYQAEPGAELRRRTSDHGLIPVRTAPLDRYLKAKGFDPPRLWVSGIAERLRQSSGGAAIVDAARSWYLKSTNNLLANPRNSDASGDYFIAWLRACHRHIWRDVDRTDPAKLRKQREPVQSESRPDSRLYRFDLAQVRIPSLDKGFQELQNVLNGSHSRTCTPRERALAQIFVDAFQLRLVDLAAVLAVADAVRAAPPDDQPIVIVLYAGDDHVKSVVEFWRSNGFSADGLDGRGKVGKADFNDDEPRGLVLPDFLADFSKLFPVPKPN
eukprot:TRINITY_DN12273_c0_g1_i1.p1 TRINITY_DN12273_c0_g1~~TRINITY_DN12273_c0_g1_i1.p1  ORF type:complete len:831 (+),score=144.56 TRINITY_DN12273_c0_g1_i1:78-2570(+)